MSQSIAIVGSGLIGRILAFELLKDGHRVSIFDRDSELGKQSCAWTGAGMLAPYSELETADELVFHLGIASLSLWPKLIDSLPKKVFFQKAGTLIIAHGRDRSDLIRFQRNVRSRSEASVGAMPCIARDEIPFLGQEAIKLLEPDLAARFPTGIFLPEEAQLDNRQLLDALAIGLKTCGADWHTNTDVLNVQPFSVTIESGSTKFDQVVDCRGLGAKADLSGLRGVRGEIIRVFAPEINLNRPIRLVHPRYPLYIAPREGSLFVVGATVIESEDQSPMTVQSALELLSAAFSIHYGFANASIIEMGANCRPALPDNAPKIFTQPGLLRINGLYRHGFLLAPKLAHLAEIFINTGKVDQEFAKLFVEEKSKIAIAS